MRILLTGDDGFDSLGTRLLIHSLKNDFELAIAGTKGQMTAAGGGLTLSGGEWGETTVDGVPGIWVAGTPADAIEVAEGYFTQPFDLVLSGINWGANVTAAIISSGTFSAGYRALGAGLAPRGMVLSWQVFGLKTVERHDGVSEIDEALYEYPGKTAGKFIRKVLEQDLFGARLLNVNFPQKKSDTVQFTKLNLPIASYFAYPIQVDRNAGTFAYPFGQGTGSENHQTDVGALQTGFISVTPIDPTFNDTVAWGKLESTSMRL